MQKYSNKIFKLNKYRDFRYVPLEKVLVRVDKYLL